MKKRLSFIIVTVIAAVLLLPLAAFAAPPAVVDEAGYLTESEIAELTARLEDIRSRYNFDVAVYIEDTMSGYDAENTADDIYDYKGYGMGESYDGIMLYLSKNPRKYHYTTCGYGITVFTDRGLEYMDNQVLPYLQEDQYYNAISTYADTAEELLVYAAEGEPYNEKEEDGTSTLAAIAAVIFAPFGIAGVATGSKSKKMNTAVKQNYADSYMRAGSMNLAHSQDIFLYSVVNRTEKPKSDSSSTHTSSSGRVHGGRGGSY